VVWQPATPLTRQGVVRQGVLWLPEALWLSFQPAFAAVDQASWRLHKLGSLISPMEVRCLLRKHWALVGVICIPHVRVPGQLAAAQTQQHDSSN
jgi:hypothetical protein